MPQPIYLDHHSTTPVDARVLDAMLPHFTHSFGNASNRTHEFGRRASAAVEAAREQVARAIGARYSEVYFTSGATESNAIALLGAARRRPGAHLITSAIEHRSVLDTVRRLERGGWPVSVLPVDRFGFVDPQDVRRALRPDTVLVSIMAANNEIGTIEPLAEVGAAIGGRALFHVDATQALGRIPLDVDAMAIDLLAVSAHKLHGPKGTGALYARRRRGAAAIEPLMDGGGQEQGLRPGTLNVPGIAGFGAACAIALESMAADGERIGALRDRLQQLLLAAIDGLTVNGPPDPQRLAANLNVTIEGVDADALLLGLPDLALSAGAACSSSQAKPSHVLEAIGALHGAPAAVLRFGIGRGNTEDEIERAAYAVIEQVRRLRSQGGAPGRQAA